MDFEHDEKIYWLKRAYAVALGSPDPSTQNGSVIINSDRVPITEGYNGFPKGVLNTPDRLERPIKYAMVEHAERYSILMAARHGLYTDGATMFCPWFACADCGRAIIGAGIKKVIGHKRMFDATPERWNESIALAFAMFEEAGVETELLEDTLNVAPIRFNGELWTP